MPEPLGDALLVLRTDDTSFSRGVRKAETQARRLGRVFDDVGRRAQNIGKQLATFVTLPILAIGVASVKTASDIQEMQNLFAVTFGSAADDVEEWATRTAKATNRSRFELQRTAADFAAFLKPLGVAPDAIVPMSTALTQLTTDIASFRNQTDEEVFTRLFSGLAGETEAVRRLGIDIGEAAIKQELLNQGFRGTVTDATQGEKAVARFALIMRQTTDAQGDAARTSESFENQTKALGATVKDVRVEIGQRLLPVATRMVQQIRELGLRFLGLSENVKSGAVALALFVAIVGPAIFALGLLIRAVGFAITGFSFLLPVFALIATGFRTLLIGIRLAAAQLALIFAGLPFAPLAAFAAIVAATLIFKETITGFFKNLIGALKREFIEKFNNAIVIPFQEAINSLIEFLPDSVIETLGLKPIEVNELIDNNFADDMKAVFEQAKKDGIREMNEFKEGVKSIVGNIVSTIAGVGDTFGDFFSLDIALPSLESIGAEFEKLMAQFTALNNAQGGIATAAGDAAGDAATEWQDLGKVIRSTMEDNLTDALTAVRNFGDAARTILAEVLSALVRIGVVRPFLSFLGIPAFGHGGRPTPGQLAIVGDRGPEIIIPDRASTVIPNNRLGGFGGLSQEFNFPLAFPTQLEAFVRNVAGPAGRDAATQVIRATQGKF